MCKCFEIPNLDYKERIKLFHQEHPEWGNQTTNKSNRLGVWWRAGAVPHDEEVDWDQVSYTKPYYDPWEIFQPTKGFIKEKIKEFKQECYEILNNKSSGWYDQDRHEWLLRQIKDYEYRLNGGTSGQGITPEDVSHAKQCLINEHYVGSLRKAGKDFIGLCPFHSERNPSFTIYKGGTRYKCFSCGESGDTIDFVMKTKKLSFPEAVKLLCQH